MNLPFYTIKKEINHKRTGNALRKMRRAAEIRQGAFAKSLGLLTVQMWRLEKGEAKWSEALVTRAVAAIKKNGRAAK